jgi:methylaspartate mutase epsilon subunit
MVMPVRIASFGKYVASAAARGSLVVQPRMGFSDLARMREGLIAVRDSHAITVGTITLDSYTRLGEEAAAKAALTDGVALNGFPLTSYDWRRVRAMLEGIHGPGFPVQVRHGSAQPQGIVGQMIRVGLGATEGGPVSYCLPYGRCPLRRSMENWRAACDMLAEAGSGEITPHLETFGGCLLGQLCPPALLVAVSVLEGLFFRQRGVISISLSYAQQTSRRQDELALSALRRLARETLPAGTEWHIVLYTYMGLYPRTRSGAMRLLAESADLAMRSGTARLVVKSAAEAHQIPAIDENVKALEAAAAAAARTGRAQAALALPDNAVYMQARALVDAVLNLAADAGEGLVRAFELGQLDVPYCVHPDNAGHTRSYVDRSGWLRWADVGRMPIACDGEDCAKMTASDLMAGLSFVRNRFDAVDADLLTENELMTAKK